MKLFWEFFKIKKTISRLITTVGIIAIAYFIYANKDSIDLTSLTTPTQTSANPSSNELIKATVLYVVDGDTVVVVGENKEEIKVRMIGVNTPESVHSDASKNTEEGKIASNYTKSVLKEGMTVYLEYDLDKQDDYGRDLAYVWLKNNIDTTSFEDFCKYNYGAILLQNTYCEAVYYKPNGKYKEWYDKLDMEN